MSLTQLTEWKLWLAIILSVCPEVPCSIFWLLVLARYASWFADGDDLQGSYERLREDRDSQWNRVFATSGICPTITTTEPPVILTCQEVPTCTDPYDFETEPGLYGPVEVEPLW